MNRTFLHAILPILLPLVALPAVAAAHPGWGLVVDRQGTIYFTDLERVWKIDPDGHVTIFIEDVHTHALYLDEADTLYGEHQWYQEATDTFHHRYWKAEPDGRLIDITAEEAARFFDRWDAAGNQYHVYNDKEKAVITKTTPDGNKTTLAGGPFGYTDGTGADARFRLIGTSVWGPDQHLYLTTGGLVRKVALDGTVSTVAGPEQGFAHSVQANGKPRYSALLGLAVTPSGTVYFADIDQRKVFKMSPDGTFSTILSSGPLWMPSGIALVDDDVYVLEYRTTFSKPLGRLGETGPRVRKISSNGTVTLVGMADG